MKAPILIWDQCINVKHLNLTSWRKDTDIRYIRLISTGSFLVSTPICITVQSFVHHSAEVLFQFPDPLLTRCPVEVTDAPEQLSEDRCLFLGQPWFEILQQFLGGGLSIHIRLEGYEVAQINQKLVMLSGRCWRGACSCSSRAVLLFLHFVSLAGGQTEVITGFHLGQQGGGGEWGGVWVTFCSLPTEMSCCTRFLWHWLLYNSSILKREVD